jgi:hypothetical protein
MEEVTFIYNRISLTYTTRDGEAVQAQFENE